MRHSDCARRGHHGFASVCVLFGTAMLAAMCARADSVMMFNEVMYHPMTNEATGEWLELHNTLSIGIDISRWSLQGGIDYTFPTGTVVESEGYIVVALAPATLAGMVPSERLFGPFAGRLNNGDETIRLYNNSGRLMDELKYSDAGEWPAGADGFGPSIAKVDAGTASKPAQNWTTSAQAGGTPGMVNFPAGIPASSLAINEFPGTGDMFWLELANVGTQTIGLGGLQIACSGSSTVHVLAAGDLAPGMLCVVSNVFGGYTPGAGDKVALIGSSTPHVLDAVGVNGRAHARWPDGTGAFAHPRSSTPGAANDVQLRQDIVINEIMYHPRDTRSTPAAYVAVTNMPVNASWRYDQSGTDRGTAWREPGYDDTAWPTGAALLYVETAPLPAPTNTPLVLGATTYYFRTSFVFTNAMTNVSLRVPAVIDDGAVVYLNGAEVLRYNMPAGAITATTFASAAISDATYTGPYVIDATNLVHGTNVLAVEVHQCSGASSDIVFGLAVCATYEVAPATPFRKNHDGWVELYNAGTTDVDLAGWRFTRGVSFAFPAGTVLASGSYLVVACNSNALASAHTGIRVLGPCAGMLGQSADRLTLEDANGNVADEVRYYDDTPWPAYADGAGSSIELRDPRADNACPEAWAASDESANAAWTLYRYRATAASHAGYPETLWREFACGLLEAGDLLLDDVSVIEDPDGAATEMIANGGFENGAAGWRLDGTHRRTAVVTDPDDPSNHVLHVSSTGGTDYHNNHIETTLAGGMSVTDGRTYEVSFRAKWLGGADLFNTRLFFNRVGHTTVIQTPTPAGTPGASNSRREPNIGPTCSSLAHTPAVPAANKAVCVTVRACDPDGVAALTNWYRLDGGAWHAGAMACSNGEWYVATIPGHATGSVVAFYIEAYDALGARSRYPPLGSNAPALYAVNNGEAATTGLHNLRIVMAQADLDYMLTDIHLMSDDRLNATVIYNETTVFYNAGVHLNGSEHGRAADGGVFRRGFNVKLPADNPFMGVHGTVTTDASKGVEPGPFEMLLNIMMNRAGGPLSRYSDLIKVISPCANLTRSAELQLARMGNDYLASQFDQGDDGMLAYYCIIFHPARTNAMGYKIAYPDSVSSVPLRDYGDDKEQYRWHIRLENNRARDDFDGGIAVSKLFSLSGAAFEQQVAAVIDVDAWMRGLALPMVHGVEDIYVNGDNYQNVAFYTRPSDGRVLIIPYDMDMFDNWCWNMPLIPPCPDFPALAASPARLRRYYVHVRDYLETSFNPGYMAPWVAQFAQRMPELASYNYLPLYQQRHDYLDGLLASTAGSQFPFALVTTNCTVDSLAATVAGVAWFDVAHMHVNGVGHDPATWPTITNWQTSVALVPGTNLLTFDAFTYQHDLVGTASLAIICTATARPPCVVINEFLARNNSVIADEFGEFDDWIELHNSGTNQAALAGMFLSDDPDGTTLWPLPDASIASGGFLLVWADGQTNQGMFHAPFKLAAGGETISLYDAGTSLLQRIEFGAQAADISRGLYPDAAMGNVISMPPTPGAANVPEPALWLLVLAICSAARRAGCKPMKPSSVRP